jgi:hypothetical protein
MEIGVDVRLERAVVELDKDAAACSDEGGGWVGVARESPAIEDGWIMLGGGPSIAHLFDSYFDRMNDSILLPDDRKL